MDDLCGNQAQQEKKWSADTVNLLEPDDGDVGDKQKKTQKNKGAKQPNKSEDRETGGKASTRESRQSTWMSCYDLQLLNRLDSAAHELQTP